MVNATAPKRVMGLVRATELTLSSADTPAPNEASA
jgi:hypothetical protein